MTDLQKASIVNARELGLGYKRIADSLGISINTVKSFCIRNNIKRKKVNPPSSICKNCGKELVHTPGKKHKKFCCKECGLKWWHKHPESLHKKAIYTFECQECHNTFTSYGCKTRKFCSIDCSTMHRVRMRAV